MKCIHCGETSRRTHAGCCSACGHAFAFDPALDRFGMTDERFRTALSGASDWQDAFFSARQLWHEINRPQPARPSRRRFVDWLVWMGAAGGVGLWATDAVDLPLFALVLAGLGAGLGAGALIHLADPHAGDPPLQLVIPFDLLHTEYLPRWVEVHGPVRRLLAESGADAVPRQVPADVAAFSFDRVVVAQHAATAAMLVANRFHFEHACAVLSLDGYPSGIAETVREMLRRNPRLTVFAIHDATAAGEALPAALRGPAWFPEPGTLIVDVGLRRRRRAARTLPAPPPKVAARLRKAAPPPRWLEAQEGTELAARRPMDVMRMLQQAFAATGAAGHPARDHAVRLAAASGGVVWFGDLGPAGDTAATDGFG